MKTFVATVAVMPRPVLNDPQGLTVKQALGALGFAGVQEVRIGKLIRVTVECPSLKDARYEVTRMADQLLANHVMEDYQIQSLEERPAVSGPAAGPPPPAAVDPVPGGPDAAAGSEREAGR